MLIIMYSKVDNTCITTVAIVHGNWEGIVIARSIDLKFQSLEMAFVSRQTMRPSLVHDASTFGESRAYRSKSTRRLVRFSVMTMCVPLSFRLLVKMAQRGS